MGRAIASLLVFALLAGCGGGEDQDAAAAPDPAAIQRAGVVIADGCRSEHDSAEVAAATNTLVEAHRAAPELELGHGDGPAGAVPITLRDQIEILLVDLQEVRCPAGRAARERLRAQLSR